MQQISTKYGPIVVSVIVALIFGMVTYVLFTKAIPNADSDLSKIMCGVLSAKFGDVVAFWLGSSSGSKAKDETISQQNKPGAP